MTSVATISAPAPGVQPDVARARIALTELKPGQIGVIRDIQLEPDDAALLRAMGLCLNATVRVFRIGSPCVVAVGGVKSCKCGGMCRVGLARQLADHVFVEPRA